MRHYPADPHAFVGDPVNQVGVVSRHECGAVDLQNVLRHGIALGHAAVVKRRKLPTIVQHR